MVSAIVQATIRDYPVDRERVSLVGISSGCSACWEYGMRQPDLFAAIATMASAGADNSRVARLRGTPVWAFHSNRDPEPPVQLVQATVQMLGEAGGNAHLTEVDSAVHDCWNAAFGEYHLLDWMLIQRRGNRSWWNGPHVFSIRARTANFIGSWQWWQIGLQVGIPLLLLAVVIGARRQRAAAQAARKP